MSSVHYYVQKNHIFFKLVRENTGLKPEGHDPPVEKRWSRVSSAWAQ